MKNDMRTTPADTSRDDLAATNRALQGRIDRLEELVELLGTAANLDLHRLAVKAFREPVDAGRRSWGEYQVLREQGEDDELTFVLGNPDGTLSDDPRPYYAGCVCMWGEGADTVDEAAAKARAHVERHHRRFAERHPELVGPDMTYASAVAAA